MNQLPTSEIISSNYQAVYDHYTAAKLHKVMPFITDFVTSKIFHPDVIAPDETLQFISDSYQKHKPIILVANHVQYHDHNVASSAIHSLPLLRKQVIGKTLVFAKAPYFQVPKSRWYNELSNVVPVFREVDIKQETGNETLGIEVGRAASALIDMTVRRIKKGQNLFLFPEGTRNRQDWEKVQTLEAGIGHIAFKAWAAGIDVSILPMGLAYQDHTPTSIFNPVVSFGEPIRSRDDKQRRITATVQTAIQESVDQAYSALKLREIGE